MKSTGIVRRIDDLGRIVIPKELRRTLGIREGGPLEIFVNGDQIVLKKYEDKANCVICNTYRDDGIQLMGRKICIQCSQAVGNALKIDGLNQ